MFSKYFSEVVSLLTEAVLGRPVRAQATCAYYLYIRLCQCGCCGADKSAWDVYCCQANGTCSRLGTQCRTC